VKKKSVYEHQDGRGHSVKFGKQKEKRARARKLAEKLMGKNYFTNMQEVMLRSAIELSERKDNV